MIRLADVLEAVMGKLRGGSSPAHVEARSQSPAVGDECDPDTDGPAPLYRVWLEHYHDPRQKRLLFRDGRTRMECEQLAASLNRPGTGWTPRIWPATGEDGQR